MALGERIKNPLCLPWSQFSFWGPPSGYSLKKHQEFWSLISHQVCLVLFIEMATMYRWLGIAGVCFRLEGMFVLHNIFSHCLPSKEQHNYFPVTLMKHFGSQPLYWSDFQARRNTTFQFTAYIVLCISCTFFF